MISDIYQFSNDFVAFAFFKIIRIKKLNLMEILIVLLFAAVNNKILVSIK